MKGLLRFTFKEGEDYLLNVVNNTSALIGKSMEWYKDWESKLNSCISISISIK